MENTIQLIYGTVVRVKDLHGEWIVHHMNTDGSVCLYGGTPTRKSFRDIHLDRIVVKRIKTPRKER